jgi:PPK2 family polyphosphate:nucleotide phosphotransferase
VPIHSDLFLFFLGVRCVSAVNTFPRPRVVVDFTVQEETGMTWASKLSKPYRVEDGKKFRLKDFDPEDTGSLKSKDEAEELLNRSIVELAALQDKLYAQDRWAILLVFQAMDAAGKDSAIKHVMSGVNPQGCQVYSFKAPSPEELDHDYLWRTMVRIPERGRIGIFNRSYYEEVLIVRVHPDIFGREKIPTALIGKDIWKDRFQDIHAFERYLSRNGIVIRKFFLNVSKKEQKKRFLERLDNPEKNWKFSTTDLLERRVWRDYMRAYENMIQNTSTAQAPWYVVPADNKWFTRVVVAAALIDTMEDLKLAYPLVAPDKKKELQAARADLEGRGKT